MKFFKCFPLRSSPPEVRTTPREYRGSKGKYQIRLQCNNHNHNIILLGIYNTYMNAGSWHLPIDHSNKSFEAITGYTVRSGAVFYVVRTFVASFTHRVVFFDAELIIAGHRFTSVFADPGAWRTACKIRFVSIY